MNLRPHAQVDIAAHYEYLVKGSAHAAERFLKAVREALAQIRSNPALGMKLQLPEREHWDLRFYRVRSFGNYLIIFRVIDRKLYVLRVLHGSQDWEGAIRETLAPKSP